MAHIHRPLPRHSAPQRKSPFCFLSRAGRVVVVGGCLSGVKNCSAPPEKMGGGSGEKGTDFPSRSSGGVPARSSPLQHTNTDSSLLPPLVFSLRPNWVSLLHCCMESETSPNNEPAVAARAPPNTAAREKFLLRRRSSAATTTYCALQPI